MSSSNITSKGMSRREFLGASAAIGLGLGLGLPMLSGCKGGGLSTGPVNLTLWILPWSDRFGVVTQELLDKTFSKDHPSIKVTVEEVPWKGVEEKYKSAFVAGTAPDVASSTVNRWPPLVDACGLQVLDEYFTSDFKAKFINPDTLEMGKYQGHYYGVPVLMENRSLFYNVDILDEAGVTAPPKTLDDFWAACEKIKAIEKYAWGHAGIQRSFARYTFWLNLCGGRVFSDDGAKCVINEPAGVEPLQILLKMLDEGYMPEGCVGMTEEEVAALFSDGVTAMHHDGENYLMAFDKVEGLNYGVAKSFTYKTPITYGGPEQFVMFKSTKHIKESWALMEYMAVNPEFSKQRCETFFYFPVAKDVKCDFGDPRTAVFESQSETGVMDVPSHPLMDAATPILNAAIQEALVRNATPQEALDKAAAEIDKLLGEWKPGVC